MTQSKPALIIDSCTDVPQESIDRYGMYVIPMIINYKDASYLDKLEISPQEVYDRLTEEIPTTSTPSPGSVHAVFKQVIADGYTQAVVVTISSGLSATYELVMSVAKEYEQLTTLVVDTLNIGLGAGLSAIKAAQYIDEGVPFSQIEALVKQSAKNTKVFFCVDTLEYLYQGGRIGNVTHVLGGLLDMRPVISCNEKGIYYTVSKARGRKQSLKKALQAALKYAAGFSQSTLAVINGEAKEEAKALLAKLKQALPHCGDIYEGNISPVLVVHTGPGLIGIGVQGITEP